MSPPRHLALVPDGNRRWARARGLTVEQGHAAGVARVAQAAAWAWEAGVEVVSFWWGSPANLTRRDPAEVRGIVGVLNTLLRQDVPGLLGRYDAGFEAIGRWRELCPQLTGAVEALPAPRPGGRRLVLLMAYDGRDELRAAAEALGGGGADAESFGRALWTGHLPPVDLVLRSGGEPHLSAGFLLWQIAEAQLWFSPRLWPDVDAEELHLALAACARAERRMGR